MKGAGVCSLNHEVHYIVWSLNRVLGVCIEVLVIWKEMPFEILQVLF